MSDATTSTRVDLGEVLDATEAGMMVLDKQGQVVLFNQACERLTACPKRDVLGKRCVGGDGPGGNGHLGGSLGKIFGACQRVLDEQLSSARQQFKHNRPDGKAAWLEASYMPLPGADQSVACVMVLLRDVTESKMQQQQVAHLPKGLASELETLRGDISQQYGFSTIVAKSTVMHDVLAKVQAAGKSDVSVLISGESGTGKELIARTIHYASRQKDGRFVPLNCSSQTAQHLERDLFGYARGAFAGGHIDFDGLLRAADRGTIYLDEIASMPPEVQDGLLRALETGRIRPVGGTREMPIAARVIASTCQNPATAVAQGSLRQDLFYRLGVISIPVPPLRDRCEDIPYLVAHFLGHLNRRGGRQVETVSEVVWDKLLRYNWPGNVMELQNAVEAAHAVGTGTELQADDLPELVRGEVINIHEDADRSDLALDDILASVEKRAILAALRRSSGQRSLAARCIGISRSRLYRRMEALGIHPREDI